MKEKNNIILTLFTAAVVLVVVAIIYFSTADIRSRKDALKVGFVYVGDESTPYTYNFIKAQREIQAIYDDAVETVVMSNINEDEGEEYIRSLAEDGCDLIFTTSFGYGEQAKLIAKEYPDIEFCQATCANTDEDTPNYHTFMGEIYEGRYVGGEGRRAKAS